MPRGCERAGFGFTVSHDAGHDEIRIVEGGAIGVRESIAQLPALVDRARSFGRGMAGDAPRKRELLKEISHALFVLGNVRVELAVAPFQIGVGHHAGPPVPRAADIDHVQIVFFDHPVEVDVNEVQARRRAPVAEQPRLDMLEFERLPQQRVVK